MILVAFAFLAGLVTILSPCILPILPIVLSGSLLTGRLRPLGVIVGFVASFTFFAVFSFALAKALGFSTELLRNFSVTLLILFGLTILVPGFQQKLENITSRFASIGQSKQRTGFFGGVILGVSLGFIWTPCVGPILASVLTLAATSQITIQLVLITFSYALGTAVPLFFIAYGGKKALHTLPVLKKNAASIQKLFGILIILTAFLIFFNLDRRFQVYVLNVFPQYGEGLTKLEDNKKVQDALQKLKNNENVLMPDLGVQKADAPNPEFLGATGWINADPQRLAKLRGKVVLVDFWTYTCINCIRTLPYITAWYEKYKNDGFVVIGVHTPEFEFEKQRDNVIAAMTQYKITYPVVQDNDYKIWESYNNHYWPAHYLIDKDGKIRYTHSGEGEYDTTETKIQELLKEAGTFKGGELIHIDTNVPQYPLTPETYLGYARVERFGSQEEIQPDVLSKYTIPSGLDTHFFAYGGEWSVMSQYAESTMDAVLDFRFKAKEVYLVMRPKKAGQTARVSVMVDGELVNPTNAGDDVKDGIILVKGERLYRLVKFGEVKSGRVTLHFLDEPVEVFAFTLG